MRTITKIIKLFKLDELSEDAKQSAHNRWNSNFEMAWSDENEQTLNKFADIFPVKIKNWEYGYNNFISWNFTENEEIQELTGNRLATYLWNNYKRDLFKGKYYSKSYWNEDKKFINKFRYSKINLQNSCVLTGYCMDDSILEPIYKFLKSPDNSDFYSLLKDCLNNWISACKNDYEYQQSFEYFLDTCNANEYEFTEDGELA